MAAIGPRVIAERARIAIGTGGCGHQHPWQCGRDVLTGTAIIACGRHHNHPPGDAFLNRLRERRRYGAGNDLAGTDIDDIGIFPECERNSPSKIFLRTRSHHAAKSRVI